MILALILSDDHFYSLCSQFHDESIELLQCLGIDGLLFADLVERLVVVVCYCHEICLESEGTDHQYTITQEIICGFLCRRHVLHIFVN